MVHAIQECCFPKALGHDDVLGDVGVAEVDEIGSSVVWVDVGVERGRFKGGAYELVDCRVVTEIWLMRAGAIYVGDDAACVGVRRERVGRGLVLFGD